MADRDASAVIEVDQRSDKYDFIKQGFLLYHQEIIQTVGNHH